MPNSGWYQVTQRIAYKSDVFLKLSPILQTLRASKRKRYRIARA